MWRMFWWNIALYNVDKVFIEKKKNTILRENKYFYYNSNHKRVTKNKKNISDSFRMINVSEIILRS